MTITSPRQAAGPGETVPGQVPPESRLRRMWRGRPDDPRWVRSALLLLLGGTALFYLLDLSSSGYANSFYAAASQAAGKSWKAWFFGSLDPSNAITVDKPPASLWISGLSVRIFGLSSWSVLVPQALEGVAAVGVLYAAVRRWATPGAGLLAGAALALTPAAALIFRFNNPDALLVLLMTIAAYAVVRAAEKASWRWLAGAGLALGFAFLTKMLQGWLVLPGFTVTYLVVAPTSLWSRIRHLLIAGAAVVVGAGWWVAIVELWPASARPYVGGSTNDSILNLIFGYNGFARLTGGTSGGGAGGGSTSGSSFGGATSLFRIFDSEMGFEISWLLPAALIALVSGLWLTRHRPRTDRTRASLLLWGGWLVVTAIVFDYMQGTIHPYYTVALAPSIAALVAIGATLAWQQRDEFEGRAMLAAMTFAAGWWAFILLDRNSSWLPGLRYLILIVAMFSTVGWLLPVDWSKRALTVLAITSVIAGSAGTAAYAVATASTGHTGSIPSVGPASSGSGVGAGGGGTTTPTAIDKLLESTSSKWSAATVGDDTTADLELATNTAVMSIGGFSGSDNSITLAAFKADVAAGKITYFIVGTQGGAMGGAGGSDSASTITSYVEAHYKSTTVGAYTVYTLS